MTELRRWLDAGNAPSHLSHVLDEGWAPKPLDTVTRARSRRRLLAMSAMPAAVGVMFWIKNIALGAVLGGALAAVAYVPQLRHGSAVKSERPSSTKSAAHAAKPAAPAPIDASVEVEATSPAAAVHTSMPAPVLPIATTTVPGAGQSQLSRETSLLEQARQQLGSDANLALSTLEQHRREFPDGALQLEREFLAVDALLRLGRQGEAQRRAAQLRAQAPGSIYEQRLTQLLDKGATKP